MTVSFSTSMVRRRDRVHAAIADGSSLQAVASCAYSASFSHQSGPANTSSRSLDTGGNAQIFFLKLAKLLNKRSVATSVFSIDYGARSCSPFPFLSLILTSAELAPERKYPSQLIETSAAYHHLVNDLGIPEERICIAGDSAGGNLAEAFLLHLARPNPAISVPASLGPTPKRPGVRSFISSSLSHH